MPDDFAFTLDLPQAGCVIYLGYTDQGGRVNCLGHRWKADRCWVHGQMRVEVDVSAGKVRTYELRRKESASQPRLNTLSYSLPTKIFSTIFTTIISAITLSFGVLASPAWVDGGC